MCSSRLAGAQQPTVLLSLKSRIVAALSQDLQLHLWVKQMLGKLCCWSKVTLPFFQLPGSLKLVLQTMPSTQSACVEENFTFSALTTFYSSWSPSSRNNPQYSQRAGNKRQPNIPNKVKTMKTPKTTRKTTEMFDPSFPQITQIYHFRQGPILPSGLWHWTAAEVLQAGG